MAFQNAKRQAECFVMNQVYPDSGATNPAEELHTTGPLGTEAHGSVDPGNQHGFVQPSLSDGEGYRTSEEGWSNSVSVKEGLESPHGSGTDLPSPPNAPAPHIPTDQVQPHTQLPHSEVQHGTGAMQALESQQGHGSGSPTGTSLPMTLGTTSFEPSGAASQPLSPIAVVIAATEIQEEAGGGRNGSDAPNGTPMPQTSEPQLSEITEHSQPHHHGPANQYINTEIEVASDHEGNGSEAPNGTPLPHTSEPPSTEFLQGAASPPLPPSTGFVSAAEALSEHSATDQSSPRSCSHNTDDSGPYDKHGAVDSGQEPDRGTVLSSMKSGSNLVFCRWPECQES